MAGQIRSELNLYISCKHSIHMRALPSLLPCLFSQAVEAKEGLEIQNESVTLASVSYQAFFRGFPKLAGEKI